MVVYRDSEGNLINIGEWDYQISFEDDGTAIVHNPLPEGAYQDEADIIVGADGGLYEAGDPRAG